MDIPPAIRCRNLPPSSGSLMDIPPAIRCRNLPPSSVVLPDELIEEILSYISVKTLSKLKTVCKAWKTLISDPTFVNLHLQRSFRNPRLTLSWYEEDGRFTPSRALGTFLTSCLLEKTSMVDVDDAVNLRGYYSVAGSCNGLVCFYSAAYIVGYCTKYRLHFCNPAMGTKSKKLGRFLVFENSLINSFKFSFGYDNSIGTYKVVAFRLHGKKYDSSWRSEVKVFNMGDNCWREIQSFPVAPLGCFKSGFETKANDGVHLIGTVNWLALSNTLISSYNWKRVPRVENFVILSLSLSTETYTQLQLPKGFNEVPHVQPTLRVLRNCLCFSYDSKGTEFVIWEMREFGVHESWSQIIKVSYETLRIRNLPMVDRTLEIVLLPLHLSENSDSLIFAHKEYNAQDKQLCNNVMTTIYNRKDDRVERTRFKKKSDLFSIMDYVESLVSII